jgi:hypothetical protein
MSVFQSLEAWNTILSLALGHILPMTESLPCTNGLRHAAVAANHDIVSALPMSLTTRCPAPSRRPHPQPPQSHLALASSTDAPRSPPPTMPPLPPLVERGPTVPVGKDIRSICAQLGLIMRDKWGALVLCEKNGTKGGPFVMVGNNNRD